MARFGLSRKAEYAVIALARLAQQRRSAGDDVADPDERLMSARELSEAENLPLPVLSGLLKQLQRANLVVSRRGVHGGYHLPTDPERIRLASVIRAVEDGEPVRLARCCGPEAHSDHAHEAKSGEATTAMETCRIACTCPIRHAIQNLDRQLADFLESLTLAELMTD
ncbi:Rrf2 family transcriptional regulator [Phycisphaerales bacterium AB-hyl4]|uniref:Rrf2 family transcriptional regulator n=1 Tax=Natronomicrosphaera hydrolytica TaxID=3242702 RepID=A0ABV4U7N1_9BACT